MVRLAGFGHVAFALSMLGLGLIALLCGDFAAPWQPIPTEMPWREVLAYVSGVLLLLGGLGLLVRRVVTASARALTIYLLIFWVLPQAVRVAPDATSVGKWLGLCETLAVLCGARILYGLLARQGDRFSARSTHDTLGIRVARVVFGASCVMFGVAHFLYADFTASMVPAWLPERLWLAYLTGAIHALAGLGIASALLARLCATIEALMMTAFVVLVHAPSIWAVPALDWAPDLRAQCTALCWASALAASAWLVARSLGTRPWGLKP
jgi:uncharacterized membrane protein